MGLRPRGRGGFKHNYRSKDNGADLDSAREGGADLSFNKRVTFEIPMDSAREGGADLSDVLWFDAVIS